MPSKPALFIDIDGVMLRPELAPHAADFVRFARKSFECHWLSSFTKSGDSRKVRDLFARHCKGKTLDAFAGIPAAVWYQSKIEAIDLASDFYWVDDDPSAYDRITLTERGLLPRWIEVNTKRHPDDLKRAMAALIKAARLTSEAEGTPKPDPRRSR